MASIQIWQNKIDKLPMKQRLLLLLAGILVIYLVWWLFLQLPLRSKINLLREQEAMVTDQIGKFETQANRIVTDARQDQNRKKVGEARKKLSKLEEELVKLDASLQEAADKGLLSTQVMRVLSSLLATEHGLHLVGFHSLKPVEDTEASEGAGLPGLYRHGLVMEFEGHYAEVLAYLKKIEQLKWRIFWEDLRYTVAEYPKGHVRLQLYTLGVQ